MRREMWTFVVSMIAMFLALPVFTLMNVDMWSRQMGHGMKLWEVQQAFAGAVGFANTPLLLMTFLLALVLGITGFRFLHSARQIDFYYSQPLKRKELFWNKMTLACITYVVPYILNLILALLVGIGKGVSSSRAFSTAGLGLIHNILLFMLTYMLAVIAMELTGRIFVGVLGAVCLVGYGWGIYYILMLYMMQHFMTYDSRSFFWMEWLGKFSPLYLGVDNTNTFVEKLTGQEICLATVLPPMLLMLLGVVLLIVAAFYLNKIRRAEMADHSMAFAKVGTVIRFAIVIPGALFIGAFAEVLAYNGQFIWMLCGITFGVLLLNGIMEAIYHMDFKSIFRHKIQILFMLGVALLIGCAFEFDVFSYDSYLPKQDEIENISVGVDYTGYGMELYEGNSYISGQEYMMRNTKLGNDDVTYRMLEKVIASQKEWRNEDTLRGTDMVVRYELTSGRKIYRTYLVDPSDLRDAFSHIYDIKGVKAAAFPVLTVDAETVTDIQLNYLSENIQIAGNQSPARKVILDAYRQDIEDMSGEAIINQVPVATLDVQYQSGKHYSNLQCMIYAENSRTLEVLKSLGYIVPSSLDADKVESLLINDYSNEDSVEYTITDKEKIRELLPNLVFSDTSSIWQKFESGIHVTLTVRTESGYTVRTGCEFKKGTVPDL